MKTASSTLVLMLVVAGFASAQDTRMGTAAPRPGVPLPSSEFAKAYDTKGSIVVYVRKVIIADSRPAGLEGWQAEVGAKKFAFDKKGMDALREHLTELGRPKLDEKKNASETSLLVQADASAPYGATQLILECAAAARIYRISFGAAQKDGKAGAIDSWLPIDAGAKPESQPVERGDTEVERAVVDEIRIIMSFDREKTQLIRILGPNVMIPVTPEGDKLLESKLRANKESYDKAGKKDVPLILDVGPHVPWRHVVNLMDIAHRAGLEKIQFGRGVGPPK